MNTRDFSFVRDRIENIIREGNDRKALELSGRLVDEWAAEVIRAHLGKEDFYLSAHAELIAGALQSFFGLMGVSRVQTPEWVLECNAIMEKRRRYWVDRATRFRRQERGDPSTPQAFNGCC